MTSYAVPTIIPEKRNEVWHQSDKGDLEWAYFDVGMTPKQQRVPAAEWDALMREDFQRRAQSGFAECVKGWAKMIDSEGCVPTSKPTLYPYACYIPEPGKEDFRRFYVAAYVKRVRPQLVGIDYVTQLRDLGSVDPEAMGRNFIQQMKAFSDLNPRTSAEQVGKEAAVNAGLAEQAAREEALDAEIAYRLTHL